mgnify:CR=1 FL=1
MEEEKKWEYANHGGNPTTNESKKYAIFIGRYQPYHQGHISLIMQKINKGIPALIMVRDIEPDAKNPFTTEQTVNMIKKFQQFGSDVKYEMSKVSWPDWNDLKGSSYVVLIFSLILTLYLFFVDLLLSKSISTIM